MCKRECQGACIVWVGVGGVSPGKGEQKGSKKGGTRVWEHVTRERT